MQPGQADRMRLPEFSGWGIRRASAGAVLLCAASALSACSVQQPHGQTQEVPVANSDDGIMLVFLREFSFQPDTYDIKDEDRILQCVSRAIRQRRPVQRIVEYDKFRQLAFPEINSASAPRQPKYLSIMFEDSDFREKVSHLGLRYIAFVGGVTKSIVEGGISCVGVGPRGACIGAWTWDKDSRVGASILDLGTMREAEALEARASGTAWFAIVGAFPIGLPAATEAAACDDLGLRIAEFLEQRHQDGNLGEGIDSQ